jgi:hypothetical protein
VGSYLYLLFHPFMRELHLTMDIFSFWTNN